MEFCLAHSLARREAAIKLTAHNTPQGPHCTVCIASATAQQQRQCREPRLSAASSCCGRTRPRCTRWRAYWCRPWTSAASISPLRPLPTDLATRTRDDSNSALRAYSSPHLCPPRCRCWASSARRCGSWHPSPAACWVPVLPLGARALQALTYDRFRASHMSTARAAQRPLVAHPRPARPCVRSQVSAGTRTLRLSCSRFR